MILVLVEVARNLSSVTGKIVKDVIDNLSGHFEWPDKFRDIESIHESGCFFIGRRKNILIIFLT